MIKSGGPHDTGPGCTAAAPARPTVPACAGRAAAADADPAATHAIKVAAAARLTASDGPRGLASGRVAACGLRPTIHLTGMTCPFLGTPVLPMTDRCVERVGAAGTVLRMRAGDQLVIDPHLVYCARRRLGSRNGGRNRRTPSAAPAPSSVCAQRTAPLAFRRPLTELAGAWVWHPSHAAGPSLTAEAGGARIGALCASSQDAVRGTA